MIICKTLPALRQSLKGHQPFDNTVGFVPTMGALHAGHLRLVSQSLQAGCYTVASIFVNPTQFNDPADFAKYPVTIEQDIYLLQQAGCHVLFLPDVHTLYPHGTALARPYDLGRMDQLLEGAHRPGHFQGVCQVVERLLRLVQPGQLFMGQKDYQQCMVVQRLLHLTGLPVQLRVVATMREANGLAMSSRNQRLTPAERQTAGIIFKQLEYLKNYITQQPIEHLIAHATRQLQAQGLEPIDYVSIADARSLEPVHHFNPNQPLVALIAAFLGAVRLIDNLTIYEPATP